MPPDGRSQNRLGSPQGRGPRRWLGAGVLGVLIAGIILIVPRIAPRSPLMIVVLCVLAILTMKLVERRIRRWFAWWAGQEAAREARVQARKKASGRRG